jgi:hypothetical protein
MKRFRVTLTENNLSGPFSIYYNGNILATLEAGGDAVNLPASFFDSSNTNYILTGNDATSIDIVNLKDGYNYTVQKLYVDIVNCSVPIPTPTPTPICTLAGNLTVLNCDLAGNIVLNS